jgi:hypothetical protein
MPYSLLLGILFLFLFLLLLRIISRRPLREHFADLKTNPDFQKWMDFQNTEYCPLWNELMEIARKNDQTEVPQLDPDTSAKRPSINELMEISKKNEQASTSTSSLKLANYSKKVQDDWNRDKNTNITFVLCSPITSNMPLSKLLQIVPLGPQNYLDSLNVLNTTMSDAVQKVNDALANEGFTSLIEGFNEGTEKTVTCTSSDGTTTTTIVPKTPEERKQEADQTTILMARIKAILQDLDKIRAEMAKARQQKAELDTIRKKGEDGSLFSKDGTVPVAKEYGPANGRLFYN